MQLAGYGTQALVKGLVRVAAISVGAALSTSAFAQYSNSTFGNFYVSNLNAAVTTSLGNLSREKLGDELVKGRVAEEPLSAKDQARERRRYQPNPAVRKRLIAKIIGGLRRQDPGAADQLAARNAQQDLILAAKSKILSEYGIDTDDVAGAYAVSWVYSWLAARGETGDPNNVTMSAVYRQSRAAFDESPLLGKLTDAQKQEMAETLIIQTIFFSSALEAATGPADRATLRSVILSQLRAAGLDLTSMTLTRSGFVPSDH